MTSSAIVQKLWNYCNVLPACRALLGAGRRDDLSAYHAQAGGMSYLLVCAFRGSLRYADINHESAT
jgi:hypothetical protein